MLAKRIEVKASSPASRYTDAKALVSGHFLRTSYTGPRYEGGNPATWWQVDLVSGSALFLLGWGKGKKGPRLACSSQHGLHRLAMHIARC